jgi:hypothetical protein
LRQRCALFNFPDKRCFHPEYPRWTQLICVNGFFEGHIAGLLRRLLLVGNELAGRDPA